MFAALDWISVVLTTSLQIIITFLIILVPLIAVHEFGHLLMARLFGVKIPEYGIGMPLVKRTFSRRWKGIIWSFYWPLLGGFVRIYGDSDAADEAYEMNKVNPEQARQEYPSNRIQELALNRELEYFLEDNNLVFDEQWQEFYDSGYLTDPERITDESKKNHYNQKYQQLVTLSEWEFDKVLESKDTFFSKNWIQQTLIVAGGVTVNLVTAVFLFWIVFAFTGTAPTPKTLEQISEINQNAEIISVSDEVLTPIVKDSAADQAGLQTGDELISFAGTSLSDISTQEEFKQLVESRSGQTVDVVYYSLEDEAEKTVQVELIANDNGETLFGVGQLYRSVQYRSSNPLVALSDAFQQTGEYINLNLNFLGKLVLAPFPGQDKTVVQYVSGPIGASKQGFDLFQNFGVSALLTLMAVISLGLAIFNMLPIPALDGGRFVILTLNKIFKRRNKKIETAIIGITFLVLIGLAVLIAGYDIYRIATDKPGF